MKKLLTASVLAFAALPLQGLAHGGDTSKIHACLNPNSGEVKILDANASCHKHETPIDWPAGGATGQASKLLSEISLVSSMPGFSSSRHQEVSRFLWEPQRYVPSAAEIFLEVVVSVTGPAGQTVAFLLHDVTNDRPIAGFTVPAGTAARQRTEDLTAVFPLAAAEIAFVVQPSSLQAFYSIQRSAVLIQQ
jgi:hypothetical protein